jgi:hypothetical protein
MICPKVNTTVPFQVTTAQFLPIEVIIGPIEVNITVVQLTLRVGLF